MTFYLRNDFDIFGNSLSIIEIYSKIWNTKEFCSVALVGLSEIKDKRYL